MRTGFVISLWRFEIEDDDEEWKGLNEKPLIIILTFNQNIHDVHSKILNYNQGGVAVEGGS